MRLVVASLVVVACGVPVLETEAAGSVMTSVSSDAGALLPDAGMIADAGVIADAGPVDAGEVTDAGMPTYERDARPIFSRHCTRCHESGNLGLASFADRYDALGKPSTMCSGQTVATCIGWVLADQGMEGTACRTWEVRAFHRPGFPCVSAQDIAIVQAWIAGGLRER